MREIKFEVFDNFNKYICIPFLFEKSTESDRISEDDRFNAPYIYYATPTDYLDGVRRPCFIREFTGLRDATGKDIYEGDILVSPEGFYFLVVFEDGCFFAKDSKGKYYLYKCLHMNIAGTIYENLDLLKES